MTSDLCVLSTEKHWPPDDSKRFTQTSVYSARTKYIVRHWTSREGPLRHSSGWGTEAFSPLVAWFAHQCPILKSVNNEDAGRPRLSHLHRSWWNKWNEMIEMDVEKWWNEICSGGKRNKPRENLTRPRFVHHESHIEWPRCEHGTQAVRSERLTACTTWPPFTVFT